MSPIPNRQISPYILGDSKMDNAWNTMPLQLPKTIEAAMQEAAILYYRLVLLVGKSGSGKTAVLAEVAKALGQPVINLNLELSARLLALSPAERSAGKLLDILRQIVDTLDSPILFDNIEILFDRSVHQDPLKLLQALSRNKTILAAWNGFIIDGRLQYAVPGHPEYRNYESIAAIVVDMGTHNR